MRWKLLIGGILVAALAAGAWAYAEPERFGISQARRPRAGWHVSDDVRSDPTGTVMIRDGRLIVVDLDAARHTLAEWIRLVADEIADDDGRRRRSRPRWRRGGDDDDDEDEGRRRRRPRWDPFPDERRDPFPGRWPPRDVDASLDLAFNHGGADGYQKGLEDSRDGRPYDPSRHRWYRTGDRGYNGVISREEYRVVYREGFREGYEAGFEDGWRSSRGRNSRRLRLPWPF